MKKFLILLSAAAAITFYTPAASNAQGIGVQVAPGVGVQIGEPKDNASVGYQPHVKGTVSDAAAAVHVLVRPITSDVWWVQNAPVVQPDGAWEVPVYIGTDRLGLGESYEIVAVAAGGNWFLRLLQESSLEPGQKVKTLPGYLARSKVVVVHRL